MPIIQFWGAVLAIDVDIRGTEREKRPDGTNCVVIVWRVRLWLRTERDHPHWAASQRSGVVSSSGRDFRCEGARGGPERPGGSAGGRCHPLNGVPSAQTAAETLAQWNVSAGRVISIAS